MTAVRHLDIDNIVADGDLDGLLSAAILLRIWPSANVHFTHPAEIRSGAINHIIDGKTAVLDLPFHPSCGLHIDHHQTNRPSPEQELEAAKNGCKIIWRNALSAARVCFDTFKETTDLSDFDTWMPMVDRLDGGKITPEEFLSDHPIVWIGRTIDASNIGYCELLLAELSKGTPPQNLASIDEVSNEISKSRAEFENLRNILPSSVSIVDRMAIARIEELGIRTNGYLVTAYVGDDCDACMIVHGYRGGSVTNSEKWPLSTSFYSNSFLHKSGGKFDLTKLATAFDKDGGGHANACGCRVQPLSRNGILESREVTEEDIERNVEAWLQIWATRDS